MNLRDKLYPIKFKHKEQFKVFKNPLNSKKLYTYVCIRKSDDFYIVFTLHCSRYGSSSRPAGKPIYTWVCAIDRHDVEFGRNDVNMYLHTLKDALRHVINCGNYHNILMLGISENDDDKRTDIICNIIKNRKHIFNKYKVYRAI